jgi:phage tail sheath gpL-like
MPSVGLEIVARVVGYEQEPGDFSESSPNLPIRVGIPVEANEAQQEDLDPATPVQITSVAQAAAVCGWGSPAHQVAKILFPRSGGGIGGIPVFLYPQAKAVGSTAKVMQIAVTGTATGNGTHYVLVAGRDNVEGSYYAVNIVEGDTAAIIHGKISDAINGVLGAPMTATDTDYYAELTSKWMGLTAQDITLAMDIQGNDLGLTYAFDTEAAGSGTPDITEALDLIDNQWVTHILNTYGTVTAVMSALEAFNGRPKTDTSPATGRYSGTIYKPLLAYTGSVAEDPSSITDTRLNDLTIKISPAPLSPALPMEAAANDLLLAALCAQNTPHLDTIGAAYPDMPVPVDGVIGVMSQHSERQRMVLAGCSTVSLIGGQYIVEDPVTTFHPIGDVVPQYRYARILVIDWNVRYGYLLLETANVLGKVIAGDSDIVAASNVIKPKIWKAILAAYALDLSLRALIVEAAFMSASITATLSTTNPDRFSTFFRYKRSGVVRIADTTAQAGFNFGSLSAN